jgi:myosin-5
VPAKVLENDGGISTYQTIDGETIEYANDRLPPSSLERVSDVSLQVPGISNLTELDEFGEGAVVYQLRERYKQDLIYTNIGSILVVVNPYARLPLYGPAQIDSYRVAAEQGPIALAALSPHVYSIAAEAYTRLYEEDDSPHLKRSQAVIISGESGAGVSADHTI